MIQSINALGTLIIGIAVAFIAYRQFQNQKQSLRLSLFERRFELFKAQQKYLSAILKEGWTDMSLVPQFLDSRQKSNFLLDDEFCSYLDSIYQDSLDLYVFREQLKETQGEERKVLVEKMAKTLKQLTDQLPILVNRYKKFLTVRA